MERKRKGKKEQRKTAVGQKMKGGLGFRFLLHMNFMPFKPWSKVQPLHAWDEVAFCRLYRQYRRGGEVHMQGWLQEQYAVPEL